MKKVIVIILTLIFFTCIFVVFFGVRYLRGNVVSNWEDIAEISAGYRHTIALKNDGTVVAIGNNEFGQCNVKDWKDIAAVSAGYRHTAGLKKDGTVVVIGNNENGQCNIR